MIRFVDLRAGIKFFLPKNSWQTAASTQTQFMFEHRKAELLPRRMFYKRLARSFLAGSVIILLALLIGMIGYHFLAELSWIDAYLNAAMILSGMGPTAELKSECAKLFAGTYALFSGLLFIGVVAVVFAPIAHRFLHKFHLETEADESRRDEKAKKTH